MSATPVTPLSPEPATLEEGGRPRTRSYPVQVIFDLGMTEFDSFYLYMPMQPAQDYLNMFDRVLQAERFGAQPMRPTKSARRS